MPKLGQHFLTDKNALKKIAGFLDLKEGETIIEIGPGHGELTEQILNNESGIKNNGIKVIAIERDEYLAEVLRKKFEPYNNIEIIHGDALKLLPSVIHNLQFTIHNCKLAGNIPYYITGKLLRTISELAEKPIVSVFTIQKEVAERICAQPNRMNPVRSRPRQQTSATSTSGRPASNGTEKFGAESETKIDGVPVWIGIKKVR